MYAKRVEQLKTSFIRDILKVINNQQVISFAGGLPNPDLFPVSEIEAASIVTSRDTESMQYSQTEGNLALRRYIVERYYQHTNFDESNILITNGSQQALDLIGKLFIDKGDKIIIEAPGYLGAIQALSVYEPHFLPVEIDNEGINLTQVEKELQKKPKIMYSVPNFQNPSGISYSEKRKEALRELIKDKDIYLIEDNPYGELSYFNHSKHPSQVSNENIIFLGSFSKVFVPAMRLGWVAANSEVINKLVLLKQSADLHTNYYAQCLLVNYLANNNLDKHIETIRRFYKDQLQTMLDSLKQYLPTSVTYTKPTGGMFVWLTLPETLDSFDLLELCKEKGVVFVPGSEFFINGEGRHTARLNFTNSTKEEIKQGVQIIADCIKQLSTTKQ